MCRISTEFHRLAEEEKMYEKILVPLDGSELAECVLPHVENIVRGGEVREVVFSASPNLL
jgi:nucleotide-binding universal stress UspA family protein